MGERLRIMKFALIIMLVLLVGACKSAKIDPHVSGIDRTRTDDVITTTTPSRLSAEEERRVQAEREAMAEAELRQREIDAQIQREQRNFEIETSAFVNQPIYFEFDSFALTPAAISALNEKVEYMQKYPNTRILIEGHCDERGTAEYNMALGERRAESVKAFLIRNGIRANRIDTISYGEEKPAAQGSNEEAWRLNRRAEFAIR